jgi:hypothetical protein
MKSAKWVEKRFLKGGILGWGIDDATGALWKYDPTFHKYPASESGQKLVSLQIHSTWLFVNESLGNIACPIGLRLRLLLCP